jgi:hypothetical protein
MKEISNELLQAMITYIEDQEELCDSEWGAFRKLPELIKDGIMPEIYFELIKLKESND